MSERFTAQVRIDLSDLDEPFVATVYEFGIARQSSSFSDKAEAEDTAREWLATARSLSDPEQTTSWEIRL